MINIVYINIYTTPSTLVVFIYWYDTKSRVFTIYVILPQTICYLFSFYKCFCYSFSFLSLSSPVNFIMPYALLLPSNISLNFTFSWPPCSWFTSVRSKTWFTNVVTINFAFLILCYLKRLTARFII